MVGNSFLSSSYGYSGHWGFFFCGAGSTVSKQIGELFVLFDFKPWSLFLFFVKAQNSPEYSSRRLESVWIPLTVGHKGMGGEDSKGPLALKGLLLDHASMLSETEKLNNPNTLHQGLVDYREVGRNIKSMSRVTSGSPRLSKLRPRRCTKRFYLFIVHQCPK